MDISMPGLNGLDAGEQIKQNHRSIKLVYLTMSAAPEIAAEAFRRGASAYVLKHSGAEELLLAIRRVLRGGSYLSSLITRDTVEFLIRRVRRIKGKRRSQTANERSSNCSLKENR